MPNINSADSISFICNTKDLHRLIAYKAKPTLTNQDSLPFYKRMFELWHNIHAFEPVDGNEMVSQPSVTYVTTRRTDCSSMSS